MTRGKRVFLAYSVKTRSRPTLVVRINAWKVCLNRVPWFSTDSTATHVIEFFDCTAQKCFLLVNAGKTDKVPPDNIAVVMLG